MNVVYTFDDGYTMITMVSLVSFLESNREVEEVNLFIVDCGISESNKGLLESISRFFGRSITFRKAIDLKERIPIGLNAAYWSTVCYVRLFFADMFPELDRIMHIDCDTVVRGNLSEIYEVEMRGRVCAACYDCVAASKRKIGIPNPKPYISNGLLVFDLKGLREQRIEEEFVKYIVEKEGNLPHLDQDVISAVIGERTIILPPKYNLMSITVAYGELCGAFFDENDPYYKKEELKEAASNPIVVHYVGNRFMGRPWVRPCFHPFNDEWRKHYKKVGQITGVEDLAGIKRWKFIRALAGFIWNIGHKIGFIRRLELAFDVQYYRKKGRNIK